MSPEESMRSDVLVDGNTSLREVLEGTTSTALRHLRCPNVKGHRFLVPAYNNGLMRNRRSRTAGLG